jgi:murein tripeptide amidase MpaA
MKKIIAVIVVLALIGAGFYFFTRDAAVAPEVPTPVATTTVPVATTTAPVDEKVEVIGKSAGGRDIVAYHYGAAKGAGELLLVGGIHGGYSANTAEVAYEAMAHFESNPSVIPTGIRVTVIPTLNPDGLAKVTSATSSLSAADITATDAERVAGRFNGNTVDLNRNFDCDWQADAVWQSKKVSGGSAAFSEPEAQAIKTYVEAHPITAAVVWYSSAGGVFASNCHNDMLDQTKALTATFAKASGYPAHEEFNFYEITGDMTNWFAKKGIAAISVLLTDHESAEWSKNQKGLEAVLASFAN